MQLVTPPEKTDELLNHLHQVYDYICEGRIYKARETLEEILGKTETDPDLA